MFLCEWLMKPRRIASWCLMWIDRFVQVKFATKKHNTNISFLLARMPQDFERHNKFKSKETKKIEETIFWEKLFKMQKRFWKLSKIYNIMGGLFLLALHMAFIGSY